MTSPRSATPPTNGNGYSQKEMLTRIEGKLDAIAAQVERLKIEFAAHEAAPFHPSAVHDVDEMRDRGRTNQIRIARILGGAAVAVFVLELAARLLS